LYLISHPCLTDIQESYCTYGEKNTDIQILDIRPTSLITRRFHVRPRSRSIDSVLCARESESPGRGCLQRSGSTEAATYCTMHVAADTSAARLAMLRKRAEKTTEKTQG
jgi:hypothetical protein